MKSVTIANTDTHPRAFLWIPPECKQVRSVVFAQNNMIEEGLLEHREFRRSLAELDIAELYIAPFFDNWQSATNNDAANARFDALLKTMAVESGYSELEFAPIIPMGHSAMASFPWNFAAWNPQRTLAILSLKGDAPQTTLTGNGRPNADWGGRNIDGIPGLMVMGEYEWLEERFAALFKFVANHPDAPIAMLRLPGRGHFDFDDAALLDYLTRFIRKAAAARLPVDSGKGREEESQIKTNSESPHVITCNLQKLDPRKGWLVDRWRRGGEPHAEAAPFAKYQGDRGEAVWTFDRELARLTEKFNTSQHRKLPQLLAFVQDGDVIPQSATHNQVSLKFQPDSDGLTFHLAAAFLESVDGGSPNTTRWTGLPPGSPISHAAGGGPITISRITGPVEQLNADTFAVRFNRFSIPADRRAGDIWLLAEHPGDRRYQSAVQQALMKIPVRLTEGAEQRITFPHIPDVKRGKQAVRLEATSDSGEKVHYYVREGPVEVAGNRLQVTRIPPRAKLPVKVTVFAWQYGRSIEPRLKSAEPVPRTFLITE